MRVLGIIPARGGSKGVPRKNIRLVADQPLIAYSIKAAQASQRVTDFVTSTDDEEIAAVAQEYGSPVLMRPPELAEDTTPMIPVIEDVLQRTEAEAGRYDVVLLLQPTAPLRTATDIDQAIQLLDESGADSVVSVYQVDDCHPARMYRVVDGRLVAYEQEPASRLRQDLPVLYHRNGAVYCCRRSLIDTERTLTGTDARPYVMPRERSVNIDDELDLKFAKFLLEEKTS